ncbi:MAG: hypothetical protein IPJ51_04205 [Saprospiraceae bacterium]|nr:hypothetical protein [Saprospiraceae bacterium]
MSAVPVLAMEIQSLALPGKPEKSMMISSPGAKPDLVHTTFATTSGGTTLKVVFTLTVYSLLK